MVEPAGLLKRVAPSAPGWRQFMKKYNILRLSILIVIILFFFFGSCGANDYVSRDKLINDIEYYSNVINEAHAEPYRMISK